MEMNPKAIQGRAPESPASPYLRPIDKNTGGYLEADLESNESSTSGLSFATASSSVADTMSTASYATAPSKYSYWSNGIDSSASLEKQARALADDPDSVIEALTRCEILASTNLPRAINIAKDIKGKCIELLSDAHILLMPICTTVGSLYIKSEQFDVAEIELEAAYDIWVAHQSDENQGVDIILFPLGELCPIVYMHLILPRIIKSFFDTFAMHLMTWRCRSCTTCTQEVQGGGGKPQKLYGRVFGFR